MKKKKKVFLGDGGSLLLGTLVSIYVFYILGEDYKLNNNKVLFSILILIYPLLDLLRVFIIRIKNRKSPFSADQNHIHHILHKKGFPPILNVILIQFTSLIISIFGINIF